MLETPAVVRSIHAGYVTVEPQLRSGCGACTPTGCATKRLAGLFQFGERRFEVATDEVFTPGERVTIAVDERAFLAASFSAYMIPLLLMLLGALLAGALSVASMGDAAAAWGALGGLFLGGVLQRRRSAVQGAAQTVIRRAVFEDAGAFVIEHRAGSSG